MQHKVESLLFDGLNRILWLIQTVFQASDFRYGFLTLPGDIDQLTGRVMPS